ncbi:MAG: SUMF1/EgtB/PvdO family nonheme iron enzyme [Gallionella sp.]
MQTLRLKLSVLFCAALFPLAAHAGGGGMLRISCEGDAEGAAVTINGKFKGDCPMDVGVPAGTLNIRVVKAVDSEHEREFTQTVRMGDDVVKMIDVSLGESKISAAQRQKRAAEALQRLPSNMVAIPNTRYEMGKYEVTQALWQAVMGSPPPELRFTDCDDTCPVESVSWNDIQVFLQKLKAKTGKNYRLPTESEWQTACLAGNQTEYCGGNDLNAVAWYDDNSGNTTHPVGQKQPNAYGLYDMSGNVREWMQDCSDSGCGERVLRGGSWFNYLSQNLRAAYRYSFVPSVRDYFIGFRLARTLP